MYEFSEDTRIGLSYRSESDADLDTKLDFKNVIRPPGVIENLENQNIDVADTVPMVIGAGIFHHLENDWELTLDVMWMQFSEFGVTEVKLSNDTIDAPDGLYEDFFAISAGMSWPINPKLRASVGAVYIQQPVKDKNRGFGIQLDEMIGVGTGITINWTVATILI